MKNKKWCLVALLGGLFALSGAAFAHDMGKDGNGAAGGRHHHHMCDSAPKKGNDQFCQKDEAVFKKMHVLHEKLHAVLAAKKFDKKAFISLTSQMEQLHSQIVMQHARAFADKLAKLSPEERERAVKEFHQHMAGGMWPHRGDWLGHGGFHHNNNDHTDQHTGLNE